MRHEPFAATPVAAPTTPTVRTPAAPPDADRPGRASTTPRRTMNLAEPPVLLMSPRAVLGSLFSFEALLVLYMHAGLYKGDPRFAWIPVDPTALFFALSVAVGGIIIVRKGIPKKGLPVVAAMICLVTWLGVSLLWSPSGIYGPYKVFLMATLALWALMAGALIIAPSPERMRRLFTLLLLFAIFMGVDAILAYAQSGGAVYRFESLDGDSRGGGYLLLGRICGPGALVAFVGWLYARGRPAGWLCLVLLLALGFVLAIGGGRGPLLSTALPLLIPIWLSIRLPRHRILISRTLFSVLVLLLAMPVGLALYTAATEQRLGTLDRLERLAEGNPRTALYGDTIEISRQAPLFGHGSGSWPVLAGYGDERNYPHNLFLELAAESGLVGLILFFMLLGVAFRPVSFERLRRDPQALCALILFVNALLNAMTTGDLPDNRPMFMMIGMLALFAIRPVRSAAPAGPLGQLAAPLDLSMARRHAALALAPTSDGRRLDHGHAASKEYPVR
jgi:O-antigen ligase